MVEFYELGDIIVVLSIIAQIIMLVLLNMVLNVEHD